MTRKMLAEERELRGYLRFLKSITEGPEGGKKISCHTVASRLITALVRAVREDCAKVAEESHRDSTGDDIAAAIRGRK